MGCKKKSLSQSIYCKVEEYDSRKNDDDSEVPLWPTGSVAKRVCTWPTFLAFWRRNYNNVKVRPKGADTCTDCFILLNAFRSKQVIKCDDNSDMEMSSSCSSDTASYVSSDESDNELETENENYQEKIWEAKKHVMQYQAQRRLSKHYIHLSRLDFSNNIPTCFRRNVLTIDMGQNLGLPNLEAEQCGDTYYFSPLTCYLFGVVDNSTPQATMNA